MKKIVTSLLFFYFSASYAGHLKNHARSMSAIPSGYASIELGGYWSSQGKQQTVYINDIIGDEFTVTDANDQNGLLGGGYFLNGQSIKYAHTPKIDMSYGLNFFFLAKTQVKGEVIQEQLYTNLAYRYNITHYPLYAMAKAYLKPQYAYIPFGITVDAGVGPNFIQTSAVEEKAIYGATIPDNIYTGNNTVTVTATAGLAFRFGQVFNKTPLECGYRFFYLGKGNFKKTSDQVITTLSTGNNFGNAVICTLNI